MATFSWPVSVRRWWQPGCYLITQFRTFTVSLVPASEPSKGVPARLVVAPTPGAMATENSGFTFVPVGPVRLVPER
jgi:hypothetical protein